MIDSKLYPTRSQTSNFDRAKAPRFNDLSNIDPFTIVEPRELSRRSKSKFVATLGIKLTITIFCMVLLPNFLNALVFKESALAHYLLDGKRGIEIGASFHNPFGLNTLNVDYTDDLNTEFKNDEINMCGHCAKVDIIASGDDLPFKDNTFDFVISSHVIEHFYDPVKTIKEWLRVVKPGGYVFIIAPHKMRTRDLLEPRTTLSQIIENHYHPNPPEVDLHGHYSFWITEDLLEICTYFGWHVPVWQDEDDKVGNGFTVVIQKD